uniref:C2H2-type domain-containing protein n=1 Tax=Glossina pallidipes TaxID=7398 RepID=A0A1A9ZXD3_GLOPL
MRDDMKRQCDRCELSFGYITALTVHTLSHARTNRYSCNFRNRTFPTSLSRHLHGNIGRGKNDVQKMFHLNHGPSEVISKAQKMFNNLLLKAEEHSDLESLHLKNFVKNLMKLRKSPIQLNRNLMKLRIVEQKYNTIE